MGLGGGRPDLLPDFVPPNRTAGPLPGGPRSRNGNPKQKRCANEERRLKRWAERQRRRRARRMARR